MVVDPERNVDGYLAYLARNELKLRGIFLTHPHADFVAGQLTESANGRARTKTGGNDRKPPKKVARRSTAG